MRPTHQDQSPVAASSPGRLGFVDVMKVLVIVVVITHHSGQAYGLGGEWAVTDPPAQAWLDPFFLVNAAFGMGLMFFLAGYFVPRSYDRKGSRRFLSERWKRIGVPMVLFILILHVPVAYLTEEADLTFGEFLRSLYDTGLRSPYFHLWFLGNLLLFSAGYVLLRVLTERRGERRVRAWSQPSHLTVIWFVIALTAVTWIVRGWFPIEHWFPIFFVVASEPAHLPQYISLFAIGAMAYRGDWLRRIPTRMGLTWLAVGLAASAGVYALALLAPERAAEILSRGGFNTRSLLYTAWEALICAAMVLGLMVLGRTIFRGDNRLVVLMAGSAYAAYMLHLVIVVLLQSALSGTELQTNVKFLLVTVLAVVLSFGLANASGRLPGVRSVLGTAPARPRETQMEER